MDRQLSVTASEWHIMELLWEAPQTLMEMVGKLSDSAGWSKSTVTTMIRRMTEKGLITYEEHGRTKTFRAAVSREDVVERETDTLLERAWGGSLGMMLSAMVSSKHLTKSDIDELYAILKEAEEGAK